MNSRPQTRSSHAFTLVELLTVITIIAILMGLLFPAISIAKDQARKAQARSDVVAIAAAVKQYYTEYGKYPLMEAQPNVTNPVDVVVGGPTPTQQTSNQLVFDILRNTVSTSGTAPGTPNPYNPRGIKFFDGNTASDSSNPRAGFVPLGGGTGSSQAIAGAYMDPWGHEYGIAIDGNYDNMITSVTPFYNDFGASNPPQVGVAVFSVGKDGLMGTKGDNYYKNPSSSSPSDDIISWQ